MSENFPTAAQIAALRAELPWESKKGDNVLDRVNAEFGLKLTSIIPLRNALNRHLAENGDLEPLKATPAKIRDARDKKGEGFAKIAARASITVAEAKKLYAKANGSLAPEGGRVYVRRDGTASVLVATEEAATE
jgi:hypothetical protein